MRKIAGLLVTLTLLSASVGCLAEENQEELDDLEAEDSRYTFTLPTLGRDVDGGSMLDLTAELEEAPVLLFWVSSQCQGCHEWAEGIKRAMSTTVLCSQLQFTGMVTLRHQRR